MKMVSLPLTLRQANDLIVTFHRHHKPAHAHRFSIGAMKNGHLVGAAIVARPCSREVDAYEVAEVARLVTDGTRNACSYLYSTAARICKEMGFKKIQTYILEGESGVSLIAAGWSYDGVTTGGDWNRPSRGNRRVDQPMGRKQRWVRLL